MMTETTAALFAAYNAAKAAFAADSTPENAATVKATWAAYDSSVPTRKTSGYSSRAGKRQRAELLAGIARNRAAANRWKR